jgi:hypothetical protein
MYHRISMDTTGSLSLPRLRRLQTCHGVSCHTVLIVHVASVLPSARLDVGESIERANLHPTRELLDRLKKGGKPKKKNKKKKNAGKIDTDGRSLPGVRRPGITAAATECLDRRSVTTRQKEWKPHWASGLRGTRASICQMRAVRGEMHTAE